MFPFPAVTTHSEFLEGPGCRRFLSRGDAGGQPQVSTWGSRFTHENTNQSADLFRLEHIFRIIIDIPPFSDRQKLVFNAQLPMMIFLVLDVPFCYTGDDVAIKSFPNIFLQARQ